MTKHYRLISMRKLSIECKEKNAVNEQCHVNLYSEETNAENSMGLVMRIYRIVPHIHSALFSTLYMGKKSAIELLLKARALFLECVENMYPKVLNFSKQTYGLFSLIKHHIYNKVCSCFCFCKGNCS